MFQFFTFKLNLNIKNLNPISIRLARGAEGGRGTDSTPVFKLFYINEQLAKLVSRSFVTSIKIYLAAFIRKVSQSAPMRGGKPEKSLVHLPSSFNLINTKNKKIKP